MTVDVHTHLFPPVAQCDPAAYAQKHREKHWAMLVAPGGPSLQGSAGVDDLLRTMDREGIERVVIQGWYWENADTVEANNAFIAGLLTAHPDRLSGFAAFLPTGDPAEVLAQARRWREAGFCGIGELAPSVQGFTLNDPAFRALAAWAEEETFPLCFHVNEPVACPRPGWTPDHLQTFLDCALRYLRLPILLAHLGGLLPVFAANRRMRRAILETRLYFDTAALPLLYDPSILLAIPPELRERIVLGSDFPLKMSTRQPAPSWEPTLTAIRRSGLPEDVVENILNTCPRTFLSLSSSRPS